MIDLLTRGRFGNSMETHGKYKSITMLQRLREIFTFLSKITVDVSRRTALVASGSIRSTITLLTSDTSTIKTEVDKKSKYELEKD